MIINYILTTITLFMLRDWIESISPQKPKHDIPYNICSGIVIAFITAYLWK
jgi:amino acid transporter